MRNIQNQFNAGELSPRMFGRSDLDKYTAAVETMENFVCTPQGSARKRGGTRFVKEVYNSSEDARLVSFEFSTTQAYMLEFSENRIRVYRNQGIVLESTALTLTAATQADPVVLTTSGTAPTTGEEVYVSGVVGMTELNGKFYRVTNLSGTTFSLQDIDGNDIDGSSYTAYTSGGEAEIVFEITTTYTEDELFELQFAQSADVLYIAHKDHAPAKLTRTAHDNWTLSTITFTAKPSDWTSNNYPRCVSFFEQRLWWAGTPNQPQTLWASKSADFENHTTGSNDEDALEYTIATDKVNSIEWLSPGDVLTIGTAGGEFITSASTTESAITPTNVRIVRQSTYGSKEVEPIRIADVVLFVQRAGHKVRQMKYSFESDTFQAPDLNLLADHIAINGFKELAYQQEPFSILWTIDSRGDLSGMTYLREQDVIGWHRHKLGGTGSLPDGSPKIISIDVIPSYSNERSYEVWMIVERTINGSTRKYVEVLTEGIDDTENKQDAFFIDSGLTYSGSETTTISGLEHLEGETVSILGDGAVLPNATVSNGSITLSVGVTKAQIGLPFIANIRTLPFDIITQLGSQKGIKKRPSEVLVRLYRSLGFSIGPSLTKLDPVFFRTSSDEMDEGIDLFTGEKEISYRTGYTNDAQVYIQSNQPLPLEILSIVFDVQTVG